MTSQAMKQNTKKIIDKKEFFDKYRSLIALALLVVVVSILSPSFLTTKNIFNVLRQTSVNAIIAAGMTFVILTGGIDLSVGSILAISGAVCASMLVSVGVKRVVYLDEYRCTKGIYVLKQCDIEVEKFSAK